MVVVCGDEENLDFDLDFGFLSVSEIERRFKGKRLGIISGKLLLTVFIRFLSGIVYLFIYFRLYLLGCDILVMK